MASNLAMIERRPRPVRPGRQVCAPIVACVAAENEIDGRSCLGIAPAADGELGLAESSRHRHAVEMRASRLLEARIKFVGHPDFDDATATAKILGPMPGPVGRGKDQAKARAREDLPLSDADLQDSTLLTREQEVHLFRRMNFLKYQAARLRDAINPSRAVSADLDRIEEFLREAGAIRNRIIRSNLGLVAYIVRKYAGPCQNFFDLVSEGNVSLIQASERFDFTATGSARMPPGRSSTALPSEFPEIGASASGSRPAVRRCCRPSPITATLVARTRSTKSNLGPRSERCSVTSTAGSRRSLSAASESPATSRPSCRSAESWGSARSAFAGSRPAPWVSSVHSPRCGNST